MNVFKIFGSIPKPDQFKIDQEPKYFLKPQINDSDFIKQVIQESQQNYWTNPQSVFENIIKSFRKQYNVETEETKIQNIDNIVFKIELKKPNFCMQAFTHTQNNLYKHGLDINLVTPSVQQYRPFTNMFNSMKNSLSFNGSQMDEEIQFSKIKQAQSKYFTKGKATSFLDGIASQQKNIKDSSAMIFSGGNFMMDQIQQIESQNLKSSMQQKVNQIRALELGLIQLNESQVSVIEPKEQLRQKDNMLSQSVFSNFSILNEIPEYNSTPTWELISSRNKIQADSLMLSKSSLKNFQISHQWHENSLSFLQSAFSIHKDSTYIINNKNLFILIGEMLMEVQNNLFWLDYDKYEWYVDLRGLRFQYVLRESFPSFVQQIIKIATMASRLRKFIEYVKTKKQRMVYFELSKVVTKTLKSFESYVLELTQTSTKTEIQTYDETQGYLQFLMNCQQLLSQVRLLYELIFWQDEIKGENLSFMNFNYRFLRSQYEIYERIMRLSRETDQLHPRVSYLVRLLFQASFQPILISLNKILFQGITQLTPKQDIYLKYYFESVKQLLIMTSKKMTIIYKESPQLYLITKQKLSLAIYFKLQDLRKYDLKWSELYYQKFQGLQKILNQMIITERQAKNQIQKKRRLQLQILKQKLLEKSLKEKTFSQNQKEKKNIQLERLRKEIKEKQERNRLEALIEKQRERGFLLQGELKNKIKLLKQKERLLEQIPGNLVKNLSSTTMQIQSKAEEKQEVKKWDKKPKAMEYQQKMQQIEIKADYVIVPIVNQPISVVSISDEKQAIKQSSKQHKTRKIRKINSSMRNKKQSKQINSITLIQNQQILSQQIIPQNVNYRQLCEKTKILNFNFLQNYNQQNQQPEEGNQSDFSEQSDLQELDNNQEIEKPKIQAKCIKKYASTGTNAILDICIDKVIQNQVQVVTNCYQILIFQKYHFKEIIKFMKSIFLSENGEKQQNLLTVGCSTKNNKMLLKCFTQCSLLDNLPNFIQLLKPSFYHTRQQPIFKSTQSMAGFEGINAYYGQMDIISENLEDHIGFQFMELPVILEPYFSYIHLSKYMQIFSFLLRIKHCQMMISEMWIILNDFKKNLFQRPSANYLGVRYQSQSYQREFSYDPEYENSLFESKLLNQLFVTRHLIQCFLKTYQNYIFFRVIEKEFKALNKKIEKHQLQDLQHSHLKVLDSIIRNAFVDNNTNNITKQIRGLLELVRQFSLIVSMLCENNILEDQRQQVMGRVKFIHQHFKKNHKFFEALYFKS